MRRLIFWSAVSGVIVLASIAFPLHKSVQQVMAQGCSSWMTPQYDTYQSESTDGSNIYTSVSVDGTATGQCPIGCSCSGVQHHASVNNVIGSVGGAESGPYVPWNGYVNFENDQTMPATVGQEYTFNGQGEVICTAVGILYIAYLASNRVAIAETSERTLSGPIPPADNCNLAAYCYGGVTPRCFSSSWHVTGTCPPYWTCYTLSYRLAPGDPWHCLPSSYCFEGSVGPGPCTQ